MPMQSRESLTSIQDRLLDTDTFATTMLVIAIDAFNEEGEDVHTWAPETIAREFKAEFLVDVPAVNIDKLMAAVAVRTTDRFLKSLPSFIRIANVLSGDEFDPNVWNPATAKEMAWSVAESLLLYPADEAEPFSQEIAGYIHAQLAREGFYDACPSILRFALRPPGYLYDRFPDRASAQAWQANQERRAGEIDHIVQEGLRDLFEQLGHLQLRQGSTKDLIRALRG